jgi:hypothetical protein
MLSFGVLLLFLPLFVFFSQFFFSSGTAFLSLDASLFALIGLIVAVIFLYFFSFFVSLAVYAVHRDVQSISFDTYWNDLFKNAALKIFFFFLVLSVLLYVISFLGFYFGLVFIALILNILISLLVMYAPESIVLDEVPVFEALRRSIEFFLDNLFFSLALAAISAVLLFVIVLIEYGLDIMGLPGVIVSFILVTIFLIPFFEQMKAYAYLLRVALLKSNEVTHAHAPRMVQQKPVYSTRLRERPKIGSKI